MTRILLASQVCDSLSFWLAVTLVPALLTVEQSPLLVGLYALGGILAVLGVKLGLASFASWVYVQEPRGIAVKCVFGAAALSGFVGAAMNLYALSLVLG